MTHLETKEFVCDKESGVVGVDGSCEWEKEYWTSCAEALLEYKTVCKMRLSFQEKSLSVSENYLEHFLSECLN